jgi:hypothetical protein
LEGDGDEETHRDLADASPMSRKKKEELLFVAECTSDEGEPPQSVYVYKSGSAFILSGGNHMVRHPSRRTENDIKREIALVYNVTVTGIKYPRQLNQSPRE